MTNDQGYGDMSCHGNPVLKTPSIDRLYAESIRFTNYHVDPTCAPTRAALMTGRYSARTGVWHTVMGRAYLRRDEVTVGDVFRANGYHTGIFGTWHLGHNYPYRAMYRGFDETFVGGDGGLGCANDYWGNDRSDDTYFRRGKPERTAGYCTDVFFDSAFDFMRRAKGQPFFCYLPTTTAHHPWNIPEQYARPYLDRGVEPELAKFYGTIANIDENVGRLMHFLTTEGLADNTILIFTTDNGTDGFSPYFNAGMRDHKGSEYDGGHRVPLMIRWPASGLKSGRDIDRITSHIDLLPTLIELCGLEPPSEVVFDGKSLAPLLKDDPVDWPERTICVHVGRTDFLEKGRRYSAMTDRWRLVNGDNLYDMSADPGQAVNVASHHPRVVARLRRDYERWWESISTRFGEYCNVVLGAEKANFALLTLMDWHGPDGVRTAYTSQSAVRKAILSNGFWAVEAAQPGTYTTTSSTN